MSLSSIVNKAVQEAANQVEPKSVSGEPKIVSGEPKIVSGEPKIVSGEPKIVSGEPKIVSGMSKENTTPRIGALQGIPTICPSLPREVGKTIDIAGCKITCVEEPSERKIPGTASIANFWQGEKTLASYGKYKCESDYLGNFEFDSAYFSVGYKSVQGRDGVTTQVPILKYQDNGLEDQDRTLDWKFLDMSIGKQKISGSSIEVPDGVKRLDYTFENSTLKRLPRFNDNVISADSAFAGCDEICNDITSLMESLDDVYGEYERRLTNGTLSDAEKFLFRLEAEDLESHRRVLDLVTDGLGVDGAREELSEFWDALHDLYSDEKSLSKDDGLSLHDCMAGIAFDDAILYEKVFGEKPSNISEPVLSSGRPREIPFPEESDEPFDEAMKNVEHDCLSN